MLDYKSGDTPNAHHGIVLGPLAELGVIVLNVIPIVFFLGAFGVHINGTGDADTTAEMFNMLMVPAAITGAAACAGSAVMMRQGKKSSRVLGGAGAIVNGVLLILSLFILVAPKLY
jgi:hypothetical protein